MTNELILGVMTVHVWVLDLRGWTTLRTYQASDWFPQFLILRWLFKRNVSCCGASNECGGNRRKLKAEDTYLTSLEIRSTNDLIVRAVLRSPPLTTSNIHLANQLLPTVGTERMLHSRMRYVHMQYYMGLETSPMQLSLLRCH